MGRVAAGVKGISLRVGDEVVGLVVAEPGGEGSLLTVTRRGYGKMSSLGLYPLRKRGGKGVRNIRSSERNGTTVGTVWVRPGEQVLAITRGGKAVRIQVEDFRNLGRTTQGVRAIKVREGDEVVAVTRIPPPPRCEEAEQIPEETAGSTGAAG